ncbi:MAG: DUF192 domain-containing protein [Spirochaetaceae bacterium]|jgi:uncharacterized membrane protein (UPF0127 family)|nr:DUF192 domain-containing protein [Spirochaetaceae bacterium]
MHFKLTNQAFISSLLLVFAAACARGADAKPQPKLETAILTVEKADGGATVITAELARTEGEKQKGLMFRTTLADGEGMLFVYTRDERMSFWMKNTLIPLSIAFISRDGRIIDILDMEPLSTQSVRSSRSVRYALEAPRGWFTREGIREGDRIHGLAFGYSDI